MEIKFKFMSEKEIAIMGIEKDKEKLIGQIFTPSGSNHTTTNAIQVCGFHEAFDLWGCAVYSRPKSKKDTIETTYNKYTGKTEVVMEQVKDIQLQFSMETVPTKRDYSRNALDECWACYNIPCTCEIKIKHESPYTVKREQDLRLEKKKVKPSKE